jgi:aspartate racemase
MIRAMKTIGLIGGMSWESSAEYYRLINLLVKGRLGGHTNARSLMLTLNFAEIEALQREQNWNRMASDMAVAAYQLQSGGADCIVLCTNTMHKAANAIQSAVSIPLIHIADATALAVKERGIVTHGLLGTRFTMEDGFYQNHLQSSHALQIMIPEPRDRAFVHRAIYEELCQGVLKEGTRAEFRGIIRRLVQDGADGIILGCTELGLLVRAEDATVPVFDTTKIHAQAAVDYALSDFI